MKISGTFFAASDAIDDDEDFIATFATVFPHMELRIEDTLNSYVSDLAYDDVLQEGDEVETFPDYIWNKIAQS